MSEPLLEVIDLSIHYPVLGGVLRRKLTELPAVTNVSFTLYRGETLGLVGESGCGKTTLAKAVVHILKKMAPGVRVTGQILLHRPGHKPVDLVELSMSQMRPLRRDIQMVFQDPYASLNPRQTVLEIVDAPLRLHLRQPRPLRHQRVAELLELVGLRREHMNRYPHEFSGGQRQRIGIARALAVEPQLVVLDEAVSALDVSVQAQVINLLLDLQQEFQLTYLFVAHDLAVVHHVADRIAVMYLGHLMELGQSDTVYHHPAHPYSRALLSAIPVPDPNERRTRAKVEGEVPTLLAKPSGCAFRTRCPLAEPSCAEQTPPLIRQAAGQLAACPIVARQS